MFGRRLLLGFTVLLLLAGCGPPSNCGERFEINWRDPGGTRLADLEEARALVDYSLSMPEGLGTPIKIGLSRDFVGMSFQHPDFGPFLIMEQPLRPGQGLPGTTPICGGRREVSIRSDVPAVMTWGENTRVLKWNEGGTRFTVIGPVETLDDDEIRAIADRIPQPLEPPG